MVINTNLAAMTGARLLDTSQRNLTNSLSRLSTGSRIVQPQDDAAGLAVSSRFTAQISRNSAAMNNLANAVSFSQTQDGFMQKVTTALDRLGELTVLAMDITKTDTDRSNYSVEFTQLQNYISDIGTKTFNGVSLFAGTGTDVTIDSDGNTFTMNSLDLNSTTATTGLARAFDTATSAIYTTTSASSALSNIQTAIQNLADMRASVGANIQRLTVTRSQVGLLNEKLSATNSRILDVDVAKETTELARFNILVRSGTTMLTQANLMPQAALQLIA
ncbi:MAG: flagellin [Verrucomicrobiota bacterium]|jgi:flagellin|nr:flagellin [Verrucomicrobiota bacterium]